MDSRFQKKYESDMTRKEKRELEREKLASMTIKEKIEYILAYYKYHIGGILALIAVAAGIAVWIGHLQDETMLYVAVIDAPENGGTIMEDFKESIGDTEEHNKYQIDTSIYLGNGEEGQADYASQMKLSTLVGSGTADVYICPEDIYQQYKEQEVLSPIADIMGKDFVDKYAEDCEEFAIRIEDNKVLAQYGLQSHKAGYLIVFGYTKHPETVKQFVEYIIE